jgi:hypothetical protein
MFDKSVVLEESFSLRLTMIEFFNNSINNDIDGACEY